MSQRTIEFGDFMKVDLRVGTIIEAEYFVKAKFPAYKLKVDFGPIGIKKSSAQITKLYQPQHLLGKQVLAVLNFPPKQIADFMSEILILGVKNDQEVVLLQPHKRANNGIKAS
ncbi:tRNA-binding protein [Namhaeicola litoreus]|uniref:tRNA-binding protein n=1 Tax=Namhaeicola litoreus TaxID=1052145 RepID=A0ABW3Y437_9FLAO